MEELQKLNTNIHERRELIARLHSRGKTTKQIAVALSDKSYVTETGKEVSLASIAQDIKAIDKEWKVRYAHARDIHKTRIFRELSAVKEEAWEQGKLDTVLKVIDKEIELFGIMPPKQESTHVNQQFTQYNILSEQERDKQIMDLLDAGRKRATSISPKHGTLLEATATAEDSVSK